MKSAVRIAKRGESISRIGWWISTRFLSVKFG